MSDMFTKLLIDGGMANMLGWILAGGMIIGVVLGNGMMKSTYRKFFVAIGIYLIIQELTRVYYWTNIGYSVTVGPSVFTLIVAVTYLSGMGIGRLLYILGAVRRARILSKYEEDLNVRIENQVPHS